MLCVGADNNLYQEYYLVSYMERAQKLLGISTKYDTLRNKFSLFRQFMLAEPWSLRTIL